MTNKIKVAVLGYGHLGKWHCQKVEAHSDIVDFVAIVETHPEGQQKAKANHPSVLVVSELNEIINQIDAAIIVTPTSTHFNLVSSLIQNKKHVFCEKPLCSNELEANELKYMSAHKDLVVQVGHSERFHESWEILKEKFQNLEAPFFVKINRSAPFKGRATDVDVVQDLAIHDLDLILYLFNKKPISISAQGLKIRTSNWDYADIHLRLEEDCTAQITVGRNSTKEVRELEIMSAQGAIVIDLLNNKILEATNQHYFDGSFVKETTYKKRDHLMLEHKSFYESIIYKKASLVGLDAGVKAVHLVDLALKALDSKSTLTVRNIE